MIAVSVAETSQTASLLVLESLQIKYCDGAGDMLGEGWRGRDTTEKRTCLGKGFLPIGSPVAGNACLSSSLALSLWVPLQEDPYCCFAGISGSGSDTRDYVAVATYLQTSCKSYGSLDVNCGNP